MKNIVFRVVQAVFVVYTAVIMYDVIRPEDTSVFLNIFLMGGCFIVSTQMSILLSDALR